MNVERITDLESLKKLEDEWNELLFSSEQNCIFLTHQWIYSWWKCFKEDNSLEILLLKDKSGVPFGIAPLMVKDGIFRFVGSQEVSDYCDFIIAYRRTEEFYKNLLNYFKSNNSVVKKIELMNIKSSSPTLTILPRLAGEHNFSCSFSEIEVAPVLDLQYSYENYLTRLSKKNRHELRRKLRRIESLKGIKTTKIKSTAELKTSIETFIAFHKKGTHSKVKFWERRGMSDFFREVVYRFSLKKWAELNFLFYEGRMIAALLNFSYLDRIYFYNVAFNRDFAWYSPGIFLFALCIKQAISEKKRKADFLRGREKYKYYFGAKESKIFQLSLNPGMNKG